MTTTMPRTRVRSRIAAGVGHLTLDRPDALNALDIEMVGLIRNALEQWRDDDDVSFVVIDSSTPRAFCAGGDIRQVWSSVRAGRPADALEFLAREYAMNRCMGEYPKPIVSLIVGYCFGGGLGLSRQGRYQVVTERAQLAMPETVIGFVPDVGATHFLPRLPGKLGRFLGLTGTRATGGDAVHAGLATHYIGTAELAALRTILLRGEHPEAALAGCPAPPSDGPLVEHRAAIDNCFADGPLSDVEERLESLGDGWAAMARTNLAKASPLCLTVADELFAAGADDDLAGCLAREYAVATQLLHAADFSEGVRAQLLDKDLNPRWSHGPSLEADLERVRSVSVVHRRADER